MSLPPARCTELKSIAGRCWTLLVPRLQHRHNKAISRTVLSTTSISLWLAQPIPALQIRHSFQFRLPLTILAAQITTTAGWPAIGWPAAASTERLQLIPWEASRTLSLHQQRIDR